MSTIIARRSVDIVPWALELAAVEDQPLLPAYRVARQFADAPCRTDEDSGQWCTPLKGTAKRLAETHAKSACHGCKVRVMCAAWAFEIDEQSCVWAGWTTRERIRLRAQAPELVEELMATVRALVNLDGIRAGVIGEMSDDDAVMHAKHGRVELIEAGQATLDRLDALRPRSRREPEPVEVPTEVEPVE